MWDKFTKKSIFSIVVGIVGAFILLYGVSFGLLAFLAGRAYSATNYNSAETQYRVIILLNPWAKTAYARLGFIELRKNNDVVAALQHNTPLTRISTFYKSALYSERAIELGLQKAWVYQNAAFAYDNLYVRISRDVSPSSTKEKTEKTKEFYKAKAISYYGKALKLVPDKGALLNNLGSIYYQEKDYERAIPYLKKAAELDKSDGRLRALLGFTYMELGNPTLAIQYLNETIALNYKNYFSPSLVHAWKGRAHLALKEYDRAIDELNKALDLESSRLPFAYFWRASSYFAKQQMPEARHDLESYLRLAPGSFYADDAKTMLKSIK